MAPLLNILCLVPIQLLVLVVKINGAKIPAIIVFGDSSVDAGNNNYISTVARSNFQPYGRDFNGGRPTGRFSNGKITTDFISEAFGLKHTIPAYLDPSYHISDFATGVTFASAATGYDNATSDVLSVIPLWKQLEYYKNYQKKLRAYLGDGKAKDIISHALYMISMGTNDFLENYYAIPGRSSEYSVEEYENFLVGIAGSFTEKLYELGARKISLGGLPPMGCMPLERTGNFMGGSECVESYNNLAADFNGKLNSLVIKQNNKFHGMQMVLSDPYGILLDIIRKPEDYGFEETGVACCATGMFEMGYACSRSNPFTCSNADKFVFWDSFHPTQKTCSIIADYIVKHPLANFLSH
ncbi:Guard-cell-enriched GDSL Lipase 14, Occluded Stomatal Pores 1 [Hibiscus trionum]|uniref:Guard-cell-enriched GDSL Lipase 14, Occluded Stomatal Pores 1 n=1 Tax=Hibiscus trionum TaxID=183268 RepID=A0A9W7GVA3_HIBTR|nr:Guard-cell-enriched GDSL Lipase 14, Occluded Stomatal Pores 1 [Hibiscus trionum]